MCIEIEKISRWKMKYQDAPFTKVDRSTLDTKTSSVVDNAASSQVTKHPISTNAHGYQKNFEQLGYRSIELVDMHD